jgi:hypothetical protein
MADDDEKPATDLVNTFAEEMPELVNTPSKRADFEGRLAKILNSLGGKQKMLDAALEVEEKLQQPDGQQPQDGQETGTDWTSKSKRPSSSENFRN